VEPDVCKWCTNNIPIEGSEFCSPECDKDWCESQEAKAELELERYLEWYNDYMAGYDVPSYEKIRKRNKREEA